MLTKPVYNWSVDFKTFWSKTSLPSYIFVMRKGCLLTDESKRLCSYKSSLRLIENENYDKDDEDSNFLTNINVDYL